MSAAAAKSHYRCSVSVISRGQKRQSKAGKTYGRSIAAVMAYAAGIKLFDQYEGRFFDWRKRQKDGDIVFSEVIGPEGLIWATGTQALCNSINRAAGTRANAATGRQIQLSLPFSEIISQEEYNELVRSFVRTNIVGRHKLVAMMAIHNPQHDRRDDIGRKADGHGDRRNIHAHIVMSNRPATQTGLSPNRSTWLDATQTNFVDDTGKERKETWQEARKRASADVAELREHWGTHLNEFLSKRGLPHCDWRSLQEQAKRSPENPLLKRSAEPKLGSLFAKMTREAALNIATYKEGVKPTTALERVYNFKLARSLRNALVETVVWEGEKMMDEEDFISDLGTALTNERIRRRVLEQTINELKASKDAPSESLVGKSDPALQMAASEKLGLDTILTVEGVAGPITLKSLIESNERRLRRIKEERKLHKEAVIDLEAANEINRVLASEKEQLATQLAAAKDELTSVDKRLDSYLSSRSVFNFLKDKLGSAFGFKNQEELLRAECIKKVDTLIRFKQEQLALTWRSGGLDSGAPVAPTTFSSNISQSLFSDPINGDNIDSEENNLAQRNSSQPFALNGDQVVVQAGHTSPDVGHSSPSNAETSQFASQPHNDLEIRPREAISGISKQFSETTAIKPQSKLPDFDRDHAFWIWVREVLDAPDNLPKRKARRKLSHSLLCPIRYDDSSRLRQFAHKWYSAGIDQLSKTWAETLHSISMVNEPIYLMSYRITVRQLNAVGALRGIRLADMTPATLIEQENAARVLGFESLDQFQSEREPEPQQKTRRAVRELS